jgi:hypothetical protein
VLFTGVTAGSQSAAVLQLPVPPFQTDCALISAAPPHTSIKQVHSKRRV